MEAVVETSTPPAPKKVIARGDTFEEPEEAATTEVTATVAASLNSLTVAPTIPVPPLPGTTHEPTPTVEADAAPCSGRAFDAFLQLKNSSIYAFRGKYFFELDDKSVLPGYPKLIEDVWGMPGPISAAFTRINCQGKSYIFKGNRYWRFEGDVLDEDYPREISIGFDGIPDDVDAAFAVPAPSYQGKEKAYFFKGDKYYQYEFKHQPSHEECVHMTRSSKSVLFTQYTDLFCDQTWEDLFTELFGGSVSSDNTGPRFISRDWHGIRPPVDAAMVGRVHLSSKPTPPSPPPVRRRSSRRRRPSRRRHQRGRHSRFVLDDLWSYDDWFDFGDYSNIFEDSTTQDDKSTPVQNVYFFKRDKYYRVGLQTKQVDAVTPPYPRSIAKYWLGCKREEAPDASRAEKKR
ncbi:vitronectin b isoform X2 [Parambassis ranga]|uniref:Vitronectin b isoform X2 n=1 Tax=Parambassis ranga TaxID=210632 RepID=A0A6P7JKQ6_9TELE|nr:vitronectin-like isoform X2 [Parambassis ranga]